MKLQTKIRITNSFTNLVFNVSNRLCTCLHTRDEHWTGLGLDCIRTITNSVDFGLDPDCKMLQKFRIRTGFGLI